MWRLSRWVELWLILLLRLPEYFDDAIVRYVRKKHNLLIGERTAEDIKIKIGSTYPLVEEESMEVTGRNLMTGLPKTVTVTSAETEQALKEPVGQIVEAIISVLERTPPELLIRYSGQMELC